MQSNQALLSPGGGVTHTYVLPTCVHQPLKMDPKWRIAPCFICTPKNLALMQYRIHVDISTSTQPICTKITGNTYQPISNHSRKFELNRISGSVEFDVDLDVVVLNNNSLFDSTSSRPICTKITENTYQLISNHSRKFELNQISGRDEFDVDFVALNNNSLFDSTSSGPICTKITGNTYQLISNHSHKFELIRISGSVGFDVDFVALYNNSLFDSTSSGPICTKITEHI